MSTWEILLIILLAAAFLYSVYDEWLKSRSKGCVIPLIFGALYIALIAALIGMNRRFPKPLMQIASVGIGLLTLYRMARLWKSRATPRLLFLGQTAGLIGAILVGLQGFLDVPIGSLGYLFLLVWLVITSYDMSSKQGVGQDEPNN